MAVTIPFPRNGSIMYRASLKWFVKRSIASTKSNRLLKIVYECWFVILIGISKRQTRILFKSLESILLTECFLSS